MILTQMRLFVMLTQAFSHTEQACGAQKVNGSFPSGLLRVNRMQLLRGSLQRKADHSST